MVSPSGGFSVLVIVTVRSKVFGLVPFFPILPVVIVTNSMTVFA
jgi:hypothetical protein